MRYVTLRLRSENRHTGPSNGNIRRKKLGYMLEHPVYGMLLISISKNACLRTTSREERLNIWRVKKV